MEEQKSKKIIDFINKDPQLILKICAIGFTVYTAYPLIMFLITYSPWLLVAYNIYSHIPYSRITERYIIVNKIKEQILQSS